jgi:hypothetical protein
MEMSLLNAVTLKLDDFHRERLRLIDEFDFGKAMRKTRHDLLERGVRVDEAYLLNGVWALKQYYAVALLDPTNMHAVSDVVDPFWHGHILNTRDYHKFCEAVFGQYVHHAPHDETDPRQIVELDALYGYTHDIYGKMFSSVDPFWWPNPEAKPLICGHYAIEDSIVRAHALFQINRVTLECVALVS